VVVVDERLLPRRLEGRKEVEERDPLVGAERGKGLLGRGRRRAREHLQPERKDENAETGPICAHLVAEGANVLEQPLVGLSYPA